MYSLCICISGHGPSTALSKDSWLLLLFFFTLKKPHSHLPQFSILSRMFQSSLHGHILSLCCDVHGWNLQKFHLLLREGIRRHYYLACLWLAWGLGERMIEAEWKERRVKEGRSEEVGKRRYSSGRLCWWKGLDAGPSPGPRLGILLPGLLWCPNCFCLTLRLHRRSWNANLLIPPFHVSHIFLKSFLSLPLFLG